jgi:hypothetical protein
MTPGIHKTIAAPFEVVVARLPDALKSEGFGVLTEIDVRETLRAKLGVDFRRFSGPATRRSRTERSRPSSAPGS